MLSDCRHPRFRNLTSTVSVDVIRVKCYLNSLLKLYESTSALDRNPPTMSEVRDTPSSPDHRVNSESESRDRVCVFFLILEKGRFSTLPFTFEKFES